LARILALEPYYGGSHRAFVDGWRDASRHEITTLTLKPHHWKWRMRHSAVTLAQHLHAVPAAQPFDLVWCSSMLNLAEFMGLAPAPVRGLPSVVYFHENQLVYPNQHEEPRDVHFAFTQWAAAVGANEIWFNSRYNQASFYDGLAALFQKMPDQRQSFERDPLESRSHCLAPGIDASLLEAPPTLGSAALRLCWAARFEHDKGPDLLLEGLRLFKRTGAKFRLVVMGEQFGAMPPALERLRAEFASELDHFGYEVNRAGYAARLRSSDVFISTAQHEFFGLSAMEAAASGCSLVLPEQLCYPELFRTRDNPPAVSFYDNTPEHLARTLAALAASPPDERPHCRDIARTYTWAARAAALDAAVDRCIARRRKR
jgi:glycosyltransferase involved in cell wall biosynthesis